MKIATWNVNSLKVRLPHVLEWLDAHAPDVLVLQEIKQVTEMFPAEDIADAGYQAIASGQKDLQRRCGDRQERTAGPGHGFSGLRRPAATRTRIDD